MVRYDIMRELLLQQQDKALNEGWRIRFISYEPEGRVMTFGYGDNLAGRLAGLLGAVSLVAGIAATALAIYAAAAGEEPWAEEMFRQAILVFVASLAMIVPCMLIARFVFRARLRRTHATCIDRELRGGPHPKYNRESWNVRILCRYSSDGIAQTGTPYLKIGAEEGTSFVSREAAEQFLAERIAPDGTCWLLVDPQKPRRAYLV